MGVLKKSYPPDELELKRMLSALNAGVPINAVASRFHRSPRRVKELKMFGYFLPEPEKKKVRAE